MLPPRCVCRIKQFVPITGLIDTGIAEYSAENDTYPRIRRPGCWASLDETDMPTEGRTQKVVCRVGACPKVSSPLSWPTVKISAVLGSKANGETLAPVLIIKVCV